MRRMFGKNRLGFYTLAVMCSIALAIPYAPAEVLAYEVVGYQEVNFQKPSANVRLQPAVSRRIKLETSADEVARQANAQYNGYNRAYGNFCKQLPLGILSLENYYNIHVHRSPNCENDEFGLLEEPENINRR